MGNGNNIETYSIAVENAKRMVESAKANLEQAKRGSNYKNAIKNISFDGRKGNSYDYAVYEAKKRLKEAQERLKKEKERVKNSK